MGVIYLLHFERSYHHARHYLGYTDDLEARVAAHRAGHGSPLVAAAVRDGIEFCVAATWPGDRHEERRLHRYRNSPRRLCPICRAEPDPADAGRSSRGRPASCEGDERLVAALIDVGEPVTLAALTAHLRRREAAAGLKLALPAGAAGQGRTGRARPRCSASWPGPPR